MPSFEKRAARTLRVSSAALRARAVLDVRNIVFWRVSLVPTGRASARFRSPLSIENGRRLFVVRFAAAIPCRDLLQSEGDVSRRIRNVVNNIGERARNRAPRYTVAAVAETITIRGNNDRASN